MAEQRLTLAVLEQQIKQLESQVAAITLALAEPPKFPSPAPDPLIVAARHFGRALAEDPGLANVWSYALRSLKLHSQPAVIALLDLLRKEGTYGGETAAPKD